MKSRPTSQPGLAATRPRKRTGFHLAWLTLLLLLGVFTPVATAHAQPPLIFIVRHAERADSAGPPQKDPPLSAAGQERAKALARMLKDAGINAIYATEFRRTQQTAQPLADALGISLTIVPAKEVAALAGKLRMSSGNALVVGHSNTVPEIIKALGLVEPISLGEWDYDNLFLVLPGTASRLSRLHYR